MQTTGLQRIRYYKLKWTGIDNQHGLEWADMEQNGLEFKNENFEPHSVLAEGLKREVSVIPAQTSQN